MKAVPDITLKLENISKEYIWETGNPLNNNKFKALENISFTLKRGEVVGIIGNNGSGKSTLLKILSQITKPTSGEAWFYGSVTSILDIGTNFHPDLTGRENIRMQLQLIGIHKNEFETRLSQIKEFSEVGEFFEQPLKVYSNGMFLRLAFSMAFYLPSDILLLDEVLAVGDEGFRLKCHDMLKALTKQGKTILFVSHNRLEILELAGKCIWLDKGQIRRIGNSAQVLSEYFAMHRDNYDEKKIIIETHKSELNHRENKDGMVNITWSEDDAPGNEVMSIRALSVLPSLDTGKLFNTDAVVISFVVDKKKAGVQIGAFFFLQDVFYQPVMVGHFLNNVSNMHYGAELKQQTGLIEIKCTIPANFLAPGKYYLLPRFGVEEMEWSPTSEEGFRFSENLHFTLYPGENYIEIIGDVSKGSVRPNLNWQIRKCE